MYELVEKRLIKYSHNIKVGEWKRDAFVLEYYIRINKLAEKPTIILVIYIMINFNGT